MKNKFIALALVTLSIATTTVSCTKDDAIPTKAENVQTTTATMSVKVDEAKTTMGKNVNRGTLPVSIDRIDVTVASQLFDWNKTTNFLLVGEGGEAAFNLDNVAAGMNNISVTTSSTAPALLTSGVEATLSAEQTMAMLRAKKPFAVYTGSRNNVDIVMGQANAIPTIELTTAKGRNIAVFKLSTELEALGVTARIDATPNGSSVGQGISFNVVSVNNNSGYIYWNNDNASGSASLPFTVTLLDKNGVELPANMQITAPQGGGFRLTNVPQTSTNCIYTITKDAITPVITTDTFTATWIDNDPTTGTIGN